MEYIDQPARTEDLGGQTAGREMSDEAISDEDKALGAGFGHLAPQHLSKDPQPGEPKLIARMTYASREAADRSFASPAGVAAVADVANFATEGVAVLHVTREP